MAERIFRTVGRPELIDDPRFRTNADRLQNVVELDRIIGEFIGRYTQAEVVELMEKAEVTVGPIYDVSMIMTDPHVIDREILADYPDAEMGELPMHHVTPRLSATPGSIRSPAPHLGQHNRELLREIGMDDARYEALRAAGVAIEAGG
jgi:crotonobetainyl-CoA:carnitine CoA-transferase CaiB-like acyl-CoA transferase